MRATQYVPWSGRFFAKKVASGNGFDDRNSFYQPLTNGVNGTQKIHIGEGNTSEELTIPTDLGLVS